jgi:hypothetical protein
MYEMNKLANDHEGAAEHINPKKKKRKKHNF